MIRIKHVLLSSVLLLAGPGAVRAAAPDSLASATPADTLSVVLAAPEAGTKGDKKTKAPKPEKPSWGEAQFRRVEKDETVFVPRGQWMVGGTASYSEHSNDNYKFLVVDGWSSQGYSITPTLFGGFAVKDNMVIGGRFSYVRTLLQIDALDLDLGDDLNFEISDYHNLRQTYHGTVFMRNYIPLFKSRRFGLFNDTQITLGGGQGRIINGEGEELEGTYEKIVRFDVGIVPGMTVFATNNVALEVSVGVLGFTSTWINQVTNQVEKGSRQSSTGNFKIDLFSIRMGIAFYLNSKHFDTKKYSGGGK